MPTPLCALTTMMKHGREEGFHPGWEGQRHSFFPALDRSTYGLFLHATASNKTNGPGLNGFQGHFRCFEHLSAGE